MQCQFHGLSNSSRDWPHGKWGRCSIPASRKHMVTCCFAFYPVTYRVLFSSASLCFSLQLSSVPFARHPASKPSPHPTTMLQSPSLCLLVQILKREIWLMDRHQWVGWLWIWCFHLWPARGGLCFPNIDVWTQKILASGISREKELFYSKCHPSANSVVAKVAKEKVHGFLISLSWE